MRTKQFRYVYQCYKNIVLQGPIRIGQRNDFGCANTITSTGLTLPWVREIRYLGSYLTAGRQFRCSVSYAKRSFYRATNAIFGKIGRFVSEKVLIELVRCKCVPILLYDLECFFLSKSDVNSLYFAVRRFLIKIT